MRISAWHFSPAPPILYAVRAIVYHKSRVLSRVLRDFSGGRSPRNPAPEPEAALAVPAAVAFAGGLNPSGTGSPCRCGTLRGACFACRLLPLPLPSFLPPIPPPPFPGGEGGVLRLFYARGFAPCIPGAEPARHWLDLPLWRPAGGLLCLPPVAPAFSLLSCPLSPRPPSPVGKGGVLRLFYARGSAPCIPGAEPARHWGRGRTTHPAGVCFRNLQLGAKPTEPPFYWQCRQPRRGGTGGEELRRLRWSSPPGQG